MDGAKFAKFARDCQASLFRFGLPSILAVHVGMPLLVQLIDKVITPTEIDITFSKVTNDELLGISRRYGDPAALMLVQVKTNRKVDFKGFVTALKHLSTLKYPDLAPEGEYDNAN